MSWIVEYAEAYDRWDSRTDVEDETELRLAVLAFVVSWKDDGPPGEADYDSELGTLSCPVPGTPVFVEYVIWNISPPTAFVLGFH